MQKLGTWYFLQHERKSVVWRKTILEPGWKSALYSFPISGIANLLLAFVVYWDNAEDMLMHHL
jgi:hypothetical protein